MANTKVIPLSTGASVAEIAEKAAADMRAQGYEAVVQPIGENGATITVKKDRSGFSNFMGLGVECRATLTRSGDNALNVNVDGEWTNKIVAMAVGWLLCLIPFITGVVGCINQDGLQKKVESSLMLASAQ